MYKKLKTEIDELVGNINAKFRTITWTPIIYFYRSFPFDSLPALYKIADIALVTPLRDGMNLVCKEYVASRTDQTGVLILSEMAGAAKELHEALIINPYNINETAEAIKTALLIPLQEQKRRMNEMQESLKRYNVKNWVDLFISKLHEIYQKKEKLSMKLLSSVVHKKILKDFSTSERRKLFLDYDGTLTSLKERPEYAKPDKELLAILNDLSKDPNTRLIIITGRDKNNMEQWFGETKNIDIIAEHGLWIKKSGDAWKLAAYVSDEWKEKIKPLMELFVNRTPGSFIEEKDYSLAWHYRMADPDLAETRSRELVDLLQYLTSNLKLNVLEGKKVVEVKSAEINKGSAILDWINEEDDFILAAGDDWTDEDMFRVMPKRSYTIKMGYSASLAKYNLLGTHSEDPSEEMRNFLKELSKCKIKETVK
jgi:trehalose 6-phosphate synthase/phosphatase